MKLKEGPFKDAVEAEKEGIIKEVYTVYRKRDGMFVKETYSRRHQYQDESIYDWHDTSSIEPLLEVK